MIIGNYIADFVCKSHHLIIELDGSQHAENENYDIKRTKFLEQQGYTVIRFWNDEILFKINDVLEYIYLVTIQKNQSYPT